MQLQQLWLTDFRSYSSADIQLAPGLTAIIGANGQGKTNVLEAIGYLATLSSLRGAPIEALLREGAPQAIIRAEGVREGRQLLVEAEINRTGRNRVQVNKQKLTRARDLLGALRVTVFAPDDLVLVKGGPGERRAYVDDALVAEHPTRDALRSDLERVLKQRNALLKQSGHRPTPEVLGTLDVWDQKLVDVGERLVAERVALLERIEPVLRTAYDRVAQVAADVSASYVSSWRSSGLADALVAARADDLRRGVSTVGPHRDEIELRIGGLPARTHASQGEQRSLALALRLAAHDVITAATGSPPVLLLDDVFSELDPDRSDALLAHLPAGQTVLTAAGGLPAGAAPEVVLHVADGTIVPA